MLEFFNTMTRKKEKFVPIDSNEIKLYTCGPTVYNFLHIGNYKTYIFEDLLRKYLQFSGYNVKQVMNLTDIDDKTIRDSQKEGKSLIEFTDYFIKSFFEDIEVLGIDKVEYYPKATDHVDEMVSIIKTLLDKGVAYKGNDNSIYFSITKFPEYGKLSRIDMDNLIAGARVNQDEYEKDEACDFCLWKNWNEADGPVFWETELGKGRPGWHIECSAMSMKYLGESFDMHCGGVDNIFPHHENEIAQSEAANGKKFVKYWLHSEHLIVENKKMSKSLGNYYTLRDIINKGYTGREIRYSLISTHYRQKMNFTFERLNACREALKRMDDFIHALKTEAVKTDQPQTELLASLYLLERSFTNALDDDLNISEALGAIFDFIKTVNIYKTNHLISIEASKEILDKLQKLNKVLGIFNFESAQLPEEITNLVIERMEAKAEKNWAKSDQIRDALISKSYILKDIKEGTIVQDSNGTSITIYRES